MCLSFLSGYPYWFVQDNFRGAPKKAHPFCLLPFEEDPQGLHRPKQPVQRLLLRWLILGKGQQLSEKASKRRGQGGKTQAPLQIQKNGKYELKLRQKEEQTQRNKTTHKCPRPPKKPPGSRAQFVQTQQMRRVCSDAGRAALDPARRVDALPQSLTPDEKDRQNGVSALGGLVRRKLT